MKQITTLIAALVLTFAETYSADLTPKTGVSDFNQFSVISAGSDFSYTPNYVSTLTENERGVSENAELNDESILSETVNDIDEEDSSEEIFDRSAGAMGLGIF